MRTPLPAHGNINPMHRTRIKMCGMMTPDAARAAVDAGADAIGMILHANARRCIPLSVAEQIVRVVPAGVCTVGVFVDAPAILIQSYADTLGLSAIQLHGDEPLSLITELHPRPVIRALRIGSPATPDLARQLKSIGDAMLNLRGILLDSATGGSGEPNDWPAAEKFRRKLDDVAPAIFAGGLTPQSVPAIVRQYKPHMVDVSSGIECDHGQKDPTRMQAFASAVAQADLDAAE